MTRIWLLQQKMLRWLRRKLFPFFILFSLGPCAYAVDQDRDCETLLELRAKYRTLVERWHSLDVGSGARLVYPFLVRQLQKDLEKAGMTKDEIKALETFEAFGHTEELYPPHFEVVEGRDDQSEGQTIPEAAIESSFQPSRRAPDSQELEAKLSRVRSLGRHLASDYLDVIGNPHFSSAVRTDIAIRLMTDEFYHTQYGSIESLLPYLQDVNGPAVAVQIGDFQDRNEIAYIKGSKGYGVPARFAFAANDFEFNFDHFHRDVNFLAFEILAPLRHLELAYRQSYFLGDALLAHIARRLNRNDVIEKIENRLRQGWERQELFGEEIQQAFLSLRRRNNPFVLTKGKQSSRDLLRRLFTRQLKWLVENSSARRDVEPFFSRFSYDFDRIQNWLDEKVSSAVFSERVNTLAQVIFSAPAFSRVLASITPPPYWAALATRLQGMGIATKANRSWVHEIWKKSGSVPFVGAQRVLRYSSAPFNIEIWRFQTKDALEIRVYDLKTNRILLYDGYSESERHGWPRLEFHFTHPWGAERGEGHFMALYFSHMSEKVRTQLLAHQLTGSVAQEAEVRLFVHKSQGVLEHIPRPPLYGGESALVLTGVVILD